MCPTRHLYAGMVFTTSLFLFVVGGSLPMLYGGNSSSETGVLQESDTDSCAWRYWGPPRTYTVQAPDLGATGASIALSAGPAADDFLATQTAPIRYIHIWGSFANGTLPSSGPETVSFQLSVYEDGSTTFGKTYYTTSTDGGATFGPDLAVAPTPDRQVNPILRTDDQGTVHIAWENYATRLDLADIYYSHKMTAQGSFTSPIMVDDAITTTTHQRNPAMAVAGRNVCISWEDFRDDPKRSRIYCAVSTDGGQTFGNDLAVFDSTDRQLNSSIAVDAQGTVHVVWENYTGDFSHADIYYARKEVGQTHFTAPAMVDDAVTQTTHQGNPELALNGQNVYVVWEDGRNDPLWSQIFCSWSVDGGQTFSDDTPVFPGTTDLQINPSVDVDDQGTLHVVCERFLGHLTADIYHTQKAAGQSVFSLPVMVDDSFTTTTHQARPALALHGNDVYVTWQDYRDDPMLAGIYFSRSLTPAFGASQSLEFGPDVMIDDPVTLTSHQMAPTLAVDGQGIIHATWQDYRIGGQAQETQGTFGQLLWSGGFGPGQYSVRGPDRASSGRLSPISGSAVATESDVYQYVFCIPDGLLVLQEGKTYWLEVSAAVESAGVFAWRTTIPGLQWSNPAIQWPDGGQPVPLSYPNGYLHSGHFVDLSFVIGGAEEGSARYDFGDAPDSSQLPMLAYPDRGVQAHFPTIFKSGAPPYGPMHRNPRGYMYLGERVTLENAADVGMDEDAGNNLDVPNGTADHDAGDDGVRVLSNLPSCGYARLDYVVTVEDSPHQYFYVNVWFDWNRDGDWDDTIVCPNGATVREWAVQNEELYVYGSGTSTLTTPSFRCWDSSEGGKPEPMWMRITLSDEQPPNSGGANKAGYGGSGPASGYEYGETEDYLLYP